MQYEVVIIGGGPAGLMTANILEQYNIDYILLEKNDTCGKKLLISGNTRCNITNHLTKREFIERSTLPHKKFLYPMIQAFGPDEVISFFNDLDVRLSLENNFKYFPESDSSHTILNALLKGIKEERILLKHSVKKLEIEEDGYLITTKDLKIFKAKHVVISTGSNSYPHTGSSGDGLVFAHHLNIPYFEFTPAETYVLSSVMKDSLKGLKGISIKKANIYLPQSKISHQDDMIFTHNGLSGPGIMHVSEFVYDEIQLYGMSQVEINVCGMTKDELLSYLQTHKLKQLDNALKTLLSDNIVDTILKYLNITPIKIADTKKVVLDLVCKTFASLLIQVEGVAPKELAYVNKGGIDTKSIDPKTMEIKGFKGLYAIGEVTDLHGPIGGFNNTIALSSGYSCGHAIVKSLGK